MPGRSNTVLQRLSANIGRKHIGWNAVGTLIGIAMFGVACFTLARILHNTDTDKIAAAIFATPAPALAIAGLCVAASYVTLTFYDWFALHTIGRPDVPYRAAALSAFTSYAIGHNIGATVFTANFIRFRMYAAYGLAARDIAKMAFVTGLTFWLGNVFVLGAAISYRPEAASAIDQLPAWINRSIAAAMLITIAGYVIWIAQKPRIAGRNGWSVSLPGTKPTLAQIGIGALDLGFSGLAMFALMPPETSADFIGVLVSFIAAVLLGFVSHAPGGLGVFDAAMLLALPQIETEKLVASLVLFRLMYYVTPFTLALILLGGRELRLFRNSQATRSRD